MRSIKLARSGDTVAPANSRDLRVYAFLRQDVARRFRFRDIKKGVGATSRVVSGQLKRLKAEGLVIRRIETDARSARSFPTYQASRLWSWQERHLEVLDEVANAISKGNVSDRLTAGGYERGRAGATVYNLLVVEPSNPGAAESYPPGGVNLAKVNRAVLAVRRALRGEDPESYHWQFLLRRIVTEVVTSQPHSFFLLSYPYSCFAGPTGRRAAWPDPNWRSGPRGPYLITRLSRRHQAFVRRHGHALEAIAVVRRWPRSSVEKWEEAVHGVEYCLPSSVHEAKEARRTVVRSKGK